MTKIALQAPDVTPGMDGRVGEKLFWDQWMAVVGRAVLCFKKKWMVGGRVVLLV